MDIAIELVGNYGLWIVLGAVFFTMHWFGMSFCGHGREHRAPGADRHPSKNDEPAKNAATGQIKDER